MAQENADARIQQWRARTQGGNVKAISDAVKNKPFSAPPAVATDGAGQKTAAKPTAEPSRLVAEAVRQVSAKQHAKLDDWRQNAYFEMVRDSIEVLPAPSAEWAFGDNPGALRGALRAIAGTASGTGDIEAGLLAKAPEDSIESLAALGDAIRASGQWPTALRTAVTTMVPKVRDGVFTEDLRPIIVGAAVFRALQKVILGRYKRWAEAVQPANTIQNRLCMDLDIETARASGAPFIVRQSDLSNCFTRLQPELAHRLAMAFERGMPQGYPASPLAAAQFAGAHARRLVALHNPDYFSFRTYVDDRTLTAWDIDTTIAVEGSLKELDIASGKKEDPSKENPSKERERAGKPIQGHLDLLGVRFDLTGTATPSEAPRAARRRKELYSRLGRIRRVCGGAQLAISLVFRIVLFTMSLLRWDGPWCSMKGWLIEPVGVIFSSFISLLRCTKNGPLQPLIRRAWRSIAGGPPLLENWIGRMRTTFDSMGWQCANDDPYAPTFAGAPFTFSMSKGKLDHYVREAWRSFMMRDASTTTVRKKRLDLPSLEVKTLRNFVDQQPKYKMQTLQPYYDILAGRCAF
ncbi:unnamed protein product [Prorocentrum cordatum]|uniref:Reverse transcriptase domain-containing protein n=1 Tax=Prorocentrum cordatum TaxID=2364126 RepID=A0ABN9UPT6_9DINO|nr:unnamed protein product [Polarella glacialis]